MATTYLDMQAKLQAIIGKSNMERIKLPPQAMPKASD